MEGGRLELGEAKRDAAACPETQLAHAWHWFLRRQEELRFASGELEQLRQQLAEEKREVENYVDHVRTLTEARDALAAECEKENEQLKMGFTQLELQHKEVEDMLEQEGLLSIVHSSSTEQVAYLLVERSSLLERIEALEQELGASHCLGRTCVASLRGELHLFHQRFEEELDGQRESVQDIQSTSPFEELAGENAIWENAEQGLDEASGRPQRARNEIPALNEEPDVSKGEQGKLRPDIWKEEMEKEKNRAEQPVEEFAKCSDARDCPILASDPDSGSASELRKAGEQGLPLERKILPPLDKHYFPDGEGETSLGGSSAGTDAGQGLRGCFEHDGKGRIVEAEGKAMWEEAPSDPAKQQTLPKRGCQGVEEVEDPSFQLLPQHPAWEGFLLRETQDEHQQPDREGEELQKKISPLVSELHKTQEIKANLCEEETVDCQKELHNYKSELCRLYRELQVFQGAAEERDFLQLTHEKLLQKNVLLETKVLELSRECQHLNQCIMRERKKQERFLASRLLSPELPATVLVCEDPVLIQGGDKGKMCSPLLGTSKMGEAEKRDHTKQEADLLKDILALQHQLGACTDKARTGSGPTPPGKLRVSLGSACGDMEQGPPQEGLPQQQEEVRCLWWDFRQAQNSCGSAEKQLKLERGKSLELKKQNLQLQQENFKIQAELRQGQAKLSESSKACAALASQGQLCQQKAKELELQLLQQSQATKQLAQERARVTKAEQRILELEQILKEAHLQEQDLQTHLLGKKQLEEEVREAREKEAEVWQYFQEEQRKRKVLEQQREEQQQQLRHLREKETQLLQVLAERQAQCQQQEAQLRVLEEEGANLSKEHRECQTYSQKLSEQLSALQQEKETLCDEQRQVLKQVDVSLRKHNERRLRHKARLRHTRETLLCEVKQRDGRIRHLENEVQLSKNQAEKDRMLIGRVTSENEVLFREKRKILQQLQSLEEAKQSNSQTLCTIQGRVQLLEGENKRLQDQTLQLSLQVGILERALRTIHVHSLEELKSIGFPKCPLQRKLLPFPSFSFSLARLSDSCSLQQAIKDGQPAEPPPKALLSPLSFQTSEISYLNVTVPRNSADFCEDEPGRPVGCDRV